MHGLFVTIMVTIIVTLCMCPFIMCKCLENCGIIFRRTRVHSDRYLNTHLDFHNFSDKGDHGQCYCQSYKVVNYIEVFTVCTLRSLNAHMQALGVTLCVYLPL